MSRPLCKCHGERMHVNGPGKWRCAITHCDRQKRYFAANRERENAKRRFRYQNHREEELRKTSEYWAALPWQERYVRKRRDYIVNVRPRQLAAQRERILDQLRQLEKESGLD